jgi:hypothetical protein
MVRQGLGIVRVCRDSWVAGGSAEAKRYGGDGDPGRVVDIEPDGGIADAVAFSSQASAVLMLGR